MPSKLSALLEMLSDVKGVGGKLNLLRAVAAGDLRRAHYQKVTKIVQVPFKQFDLSFRIAQAELTPYLELREIISRIKPSDDELSKWTLLDCGANIGMFSLFMRQAKYIVAVEPNPVCAARVRTNFERNGVRGEVVEAAISETDGTVRMAIDAAATGLSKVSAEGGLEVPAFTLDSLLTRHSIESVDLLKMDLENHEMQALRGARASLERGAFRRILTECYGAEKLDQFDAFLAPYGMRRTMSHDYNVMYSLQ